MVKALFESQQIVNLNAERDALFASLAWIVQFCGEHPEWFGDDGPDEGAEFEWLESARLLVSEAAA